MATEDATPGPVKARSWWRQARVWRRIGSDAAAFAVGATAAVISWTHIVYVALVYGSQHQAAWTANLYPVSIDGMMIVGVVKAADDRANGREVRGWARVATWVGGMLSIAAQVTSAWTDGWVARAVATVPSGTLIIVVEVMARRGRIRAERRPRWWHAITGRLSTPTEPVVETAAPSPAPAPSPVSAPPAPLAPAFSAGPAEPIVAELIADVEPERKPRRRRPGKGYPTPDTSVVMLHQATQPDDVMVESVP